MANIAPTDLTPVPSAQGFQAHDHGSAEFLLNAVSLAGNPTGPGNALGLTTRGIMPMPHRYTWQTQVAGGTLTSITVNLEGSLDGTTWFQLDQTTTATGETRHVVNKPIRYVRANVVAVTVASGTPTLSVIFGE